MASNEKGSRPEDSEASAERAHDLYWNSDKSVNAIAEELGLSKGRLYDLIRPIPADTPCPDCDGPSVFENRTARDRNEPTCPDCDDLELDDGVEFSGGSSVQDSIQDSIQSIPADSRALVVGIVLGVGAGLVLANVLRR